MFEQYLKLLSKNQFFKYTIIRLPNIYGPGNGSISQKPDRGILNKIIFNSIKNNDPLYLYGNGNNFRDFIFINDLSNLFVKVILKPKNTENQTFNLSSNSKTTLNDFFDNLVVVLKNCGIRRIIKNIPWPQYTLPINRRSYRVKYDCILEGIGWKPNTNLKKGLFKTIDIYKNEINK